jgi:hypothetical protein
MKTTRTATVDMMQVPCWVVAYNTLTGKSRTELETLARRNGWDGKTFGVTVMTLMLMYWELTGRKPSLGASRNVREAGVTVGRFNDPTFTGLVVCEGHVMPCVRGRITNLCGHRDFVIQFIVAM